MNNEDIKVLEKELANIRNLIEYYTFESLDYDKKFRMEKFEKAIENLIKGYKELKEKIDILENEILYKTIPTEKVREKIKELDDIESEYSKKIIEAPTGLVTGVVQYAFKELLQEGDNK